MMRFLDLDLDFFLSGNAYRGWFGDERPGPEYRPWSPCRVRHFLEKRCGLSGNAPVQGRTLERHDGVIEFWRMLIESGEICAPFDVVHIDAHPDLWAGGGVYLASGFFHVDRGRLRAVLDRKYIHEGNYLTFAIANGWISSLLWIHLRPRQKRPPQWDADARSGLLHFEKKTGSNAGGPDPPQYKSAVSFKSMPWHKFRADTPFDYIAFSKSPEFTPPESDRLIPVIEEYIRQI